MACLAVEPWPDVHGNDPAGRRRSDRGTAYCTFLFT
jgi:hypothetical protein